jgi:hypothetical protein
MYPCVTTHVDSTLTDLYIGSWSPASDTCHFKVSVLVPLEKHFHVLGFLPIPINRWTLKMHIFYEPIIPLLDTRSTEICTYVYMYTPGDCTIMFLNISFTVVKLWNNIIVYWPYSGFKNWDIFMQGNNISY